MALPPLRTQVGADASGFTSGIGTAAASLTGFKGGLLATAGALGAAGLVGGLTKATSAFARFDEKMTESQAIMGDLSEGTMARMEQQALDVSRTTLKSADEAAESYFFLASAGLDAEQSIAALPQVSRFAQAGMFDMARATELATDAQSALGLTSQDAQENLEGLTRTTDVLVSANQQANATVEQFSDALTNKLGARLRILNKDIEEGVAGLAALADQGIKGRRAGRGLSIVFRDLAREAVKSEGAFERLGIQVFDADGNMRNLADIVADFEQQLGGMNDKQRTAELQMLGINRRAIGFLNTLIGMSDQIAEYEGNLDSAGGATEEVADKQVATLNKQMDLLGDEMAAASIQTGGMVAEVLNLTENVNLLRRGIRNIREELQGFEDRMKSAFGAEGAQQLQSAIDRIAFQFDELDSGDLQDQIAGLGQSLREEFGEPAARRFEAAANAAIEGVQRGRIEAENLNQVLSERFRIIARQRELNRQRRREAEEGEGDGEEQLSAEEKERRRQRQATAKAEQALQQVRLRMLEKELGLTGRIVRRRKEELQQLAASGAEQEKILSKAREVAELQREGLDTAERFQPGVTTPAAAGGGGGEGLPAGEKVEGPAGGMPDVSELDVSDPVGRTVKALEDGLVPAMDELAGKAIQGEGALATLADAILSTFAKEFSGEEGILGLGAKLAGGFAGGFQSGGRVPAGTFGIAGESGPEPFIAPRGGRILSNREARRAMQGGGGKRELVVNVNQNIRALDAAEVDTVLRRGGKEAIVEAVLEAANQSSDVSRAIVAGGG